MRRYAALLTVGVTLALAGGTTTQAQASPAACSTVVTDDAGVLSPAEVTELAQHAARLAATTELRIRTERSLFTGTLNGDEGSLQQDCRWASSTAGVRQPRLLVIMVATESRQMGIYPGTALVPTITKPIWLSIEQKEMRPHFAQADWVGGLEAGVDALQKVLGKAGNVAPQSPPASSPASSSAATPSATSAAPSATSAAASVDGAGQGPIQNDANGNLIQGDGSSAHPYVEDPNGLLPGSQNGLGASSTHGAAAFGAVFGIVVVLAIVGIIVGIAKGGGSGRRNNRGYRGPDGVWIGGVDPVHEQHHQHHPGMGSGFDGGMGPGGFGGGGDLGGGGGGGGSSSDGGGGSSGF